MSYQNHEPRAATPEIRFGQTDWDLYPTSFINGARDLAMTIRADTLKQQAYPLFRSTILARMAVASASLELEAHQKLPAVDYPEDSSLNNPDHVAFVEHNHYLATRRRETQDTVTKIMLEVAQPELEKPYKELELDFNRLVAETTREVGDDPQNLIAQNIKTGSLIELINFNLGSESDDKSSKVVD